MCGGLVACSAQFSTSPSAILSQPSTPESSYCGTTQFGSTPSPGTVVSGTASYIYRTFDLANGGLLGTAERYIEYAEVHIEDSSGNTIECGETAATTGAFSLTVPRTAGSYTLKVFARANNSKLKASVLKDPYTNGLYSISTSFTITSSSSSVPLGKITAQANESIAPNIEGAAFHILYNILRANDYLRSSLSNASFVAPKVQIYWKAGFNPYTYVYPTATSGVSFYQPGTSQLFVLGGLNGDVKTSDTDHFDDPIINHEYGHFLEDIYSRSDSPGGSHNGDAIIDPRLAWSEAWAHFVQGAVRTSNDPDSKYMWDTVGYKSNASDSSAGLGSFFNLASTSGTRPDKPSSSGEGVFRELAIARALYRTLTEVPVTFDKFWTSFTELKSLLNTSTEPPFNSSGRFFKHLATRASLNSTILSDEKQNSTLADYSSVAAVSGSACSPTLALMEVAEQNVCIGTCESKADQLRSNDFFSYYYDGTAGVSFDLNYTVTSSGNPVDVDLILYKQSYIYSEDQAGTSNSTVALQDRRTLNSMSGSRSITLTGLSVGWYLINIKAKTYQVTTGGSANYELVKKLNGTSQGYLCPSN